MEFFEVSYVLLWIVTILNIVLLGAAVVLLSHVRSRPPAADAAAKSLLPLGSTAPDFSAFDVRLRRSVHSSEFRGRPVVLCFLSATCRECRVLLRELAAWNATDVTGVVLFCHGTERACAEEASGLPESIPVLMEEASTVTANFQIVGLPMAVIVDASWRVVGFRYPSDSTDILESLLVRDRYPRRDGLVQRPGVQSTTRVGAVAVSEGSLNISMEGGRLSHSVQGEGP